MFFLFKMKLDHQKFKQALKWIAKNNNSNVREMLTKNGFNKGIIYTLEHDNNLTIGKLEKLFKAFHLNPFSFIFTTSPVSQDFNPLIDLTDNFKNSYIDSNIKNLFKRHIYSTQEFILFVFTLFNTVKNLFKSSKIYLCFSGDTECTINVEITSDIKCVLRLKYFKYKIYSCIIQNDPDAINDKSLFYLTFDSFNRFINIINRLLIAYKEVYF